MTDTLRQFIALVISKCLDYHVYKFLKIEHVNQRIIFSQKDCIHKACCYSQAPYIMLNSIFLNILTF